MVGSKEFQEDAGDEVADGCKSGVPRLKDGKEAAVELWPGPDLNPRYGNEVNCCGGDAGDYCRDAKDDGVWCEAHCGKGGTQGKVGVSVEGFGQEERLGHFAQHQKSHYSTGKGEGQVQAECRFGHAQFVDKKEGKGEDQKW